MNFEVFKRELSEGNIIFTFTNGKFQSDDIFPAKDTIIAINKYHGEVEQELPPFAYEVENSPSEQQLLELFETGETTGIRENEFTVHF